MTHVIGRCSDSKALSFRNEQMNNDKLDKVLRAKKLSKTPNFSILVNYKQTKLNGM